MALATSRWLTMRFLTTTSRLLEGGLRLGGVADLPAKRHVVRRDLVDLRRALLSGPLGGGHRRQRLPVHRNQIGGVVGGVLALRDHHRDRIAHVAGGLAGQRRVRRDLQLGQEPAAGQRVDPGHVLAGEDGDHARMRLGLGDVDAADLRVGVRAPHERGIGHAGQLEVVGVVALAGDEAGVLAPLDARAEQPSRRRCHGLPPTASPMFSAAYWMAFTML